MESKSAVFKLAAVAALVVLTCHGPHTSQYGGQANVYQLTIVSGNNQTGPLGQPLPTPLGVYIGDIANNVRQPGLYVKFKIVDGSGSLSPTNTTSAVVQSDTGAVARTYLTPLDVPGTLTVEASISGASSVEFTCTGN